MGRRIPALTLIAAAAACARAPGGSGGAAGGSTTATSTTTGPGTAAPGGSSGATGGGSGTGIEGECILWEQDCPGRNTKCMPWSAEADRVPDTTKCCPLDPNPKQIGSDCTISGYDGSCEDNCAKGAVCIQDDPRALSGVCGQLCDVTADVPCPPGKTCKPFFEMIPAAPVVPVCMDQCDPLLQDCTRPGWSCIPDSPTAGGMSGFLCAPPPPEPRKPLFAACALANDCAPGLACVPAALVPGCTFLFCCTSYCDLTEPDPCPGLSPELACLDWMSPDPQWDHVGVCGIPQ